MATFLKISLHLKREYPLQRGFEETLSALVAIVEAADDAGIKLAGKYFLTASPEFVFQGKWRPVGSNIGFDYFPTTLTATLRKEGNGSVISVNTSTSLIFILLYVMFSLSILIALIAPAKSAATTNAPAFVLCVLAIFCIDRFVKRYLMQCFDHDLQLCLRRCIENRMQEENPGKP